MGAFLAYLKHFFVLDNPVSYMAKSYNDYTGPGYKRFKSSPYFVRGGITRAPYHKAEVAAFSEITKLFLLIGIVMFASIFLWFAVLAIQLMLDPKFQTFTNLAILLPIIIALVYCSLCMFPQFIFVCKNFKVVK